MRLQASCWALSSHSSFSRKILQMRTEHRLSVHRYGATVRPTHSCGSAVHPQLNPNQKNKESVRIQGQLASKHKADPTGPASQDGGLTSVF